MNEVYLDYNGSAPLDPRVAEMMVPVLTQNVGNASSIHRFGRRQAALVDEAREHLAGLVGAKPKGVVFTSGATEANNLVIRGLAEAAPASRPRILVSAVEHPSVLETARFVSRQGLAKVDFLPVTPGGHLDLDALDSLVRDDVMAISVMAANSETGVLNPVAQIAEIAHAVGAWFHSDATQHVGRLPFDMTAIGADFVSMSGHKICGPGGVGALVGTRQSLRQLPPLLHGGGHEDGRRSGSLNVAGIVGIGEAARIATAERESEALTVAALRDRLVRSIMSRLPDVSQNGDIAHRLPNTANLRFIDADGEAVVSNMDPVAVSTGSACSAGSIEPSHVLLAMGLNSDAAFEAVRFSLGRFTSDDDIDVAIERTVTAVEYVRTVSNPETN
ncbi:MAG: cysteine desulfurase family protein [Actinomycetota bacterium]